MPSRFHCGACRVNIGKSAFLKSNRMNPHRQSSSRSRSLFALGLLFCTTLVALASAPAPLPPTPTPQQLAWQRMELTMFLHFGMNTFTDREWGEGKEDEKLFNPSALDARQWVRTAKTGGFKLMILTVKHHDGFCLWPSKYTEHCVKNSPWKHGKGDVVREFVDACRAEGMKIGLYLSPWDRNNPGYGSDAYNDYFVNQLTELLTNYGPVDEMWFDGACGEGPNGKKQLYAWPRYYDTIRKLAPQALIAVSGPDIRWVGNESGLARVGESSVQPDKSSPKWYPAECDVSIRPGWFHHQAEDAKVKSLDQLVDLYFKSAGRNSVLLLNVPPDKHGLLADADVARLKEFGAAVRGLNERSVTADATATAGATREPAQQFAPQLVLDDNADTCWATPDDITFASLEVTLKTPREINVISVGEALTFGERVSKYHIEVAQAGQWRTVARGTIIGQRNLFSIPRTTVGGLRLVIEAARACPAIASFGAYLAPVTPPGQLPPVESLARGRPVKVSNVHSPEFSGDKAVDGDPNTRWATSDVTRACWLEVDLGQGRHFDRVTINELTPRIRKFAIQYRMNEMDPWQTALAGTDAGQNFNQRFPKVMGRYVRLNILDASLAPTIFEFGVYMAENE